MITTVPRMSQRWPAGVHTRLKLAVRGMTRSGNSVGLEQCRPALEEGHTIHHQDHRRRAAVPGANAGLPAASSEQQRRIHHGDDESIRPPPPEAPVSGRPHTYPTWGMG